MEGLLPRSLRHGVEDRYPCSPMLTVRLCDELRRASNAGHDLSLDNLEKLPTVCATLRKRQSVMR